MTAPIPTTEPASINAGDTVKWLKTLTDYPASAGWLLAYVLINAAGKVTFSASVQGDDHLVNVGAATSTAWQAGAYDYRAQVSKNGEVYTVGCGRIVINAAFGSATLDARSQARQALEAIEATLTGRASSATAEYEIAGRKMKFIPFPELLALRDRLRQDVAREDAAAAAGAGLPNKNRIFVRFGP